VFANNYIGKERTGAHGMLEDSINDLSTTTALLMCQILKRY
jgi:hypothetical protein